jgi:hypothetical protein
MKKFLRYLTLVWVAFVVGIFAYANLSLSPGDKTRLAMQSDWETQSFAARRVAEQTITRTLRDPDSAKFSGESVHYRCDPQSVAGAHSAPSKSCLPVTAVCGELNAKNGFGAYVGAERFVFIEGRPTMFETKSAGFAPVWRELCS